MYILTSPEWMYYDINQTIWTEHLVLHKASTFVKCKWFCNQTTILMRWNYCSNIGLMKWIFIFTDLSKHYIINEFLIHYHFDESINYNKIVNSSSKQNYM